MRAIALVFVLSIALLSTVAMADVPSLINYQGTLTDENGVALDDTVSMAFSIYTDSVGGTQVWTETQLAVAVGSGLFHVLLGSVNAIQDTVFKDPERWLGVQVESDPELVPRQRIASVAYALMAGSGGGGNDGDWTISGNHMYSAVPGSVGVGTSSPAAKLDVRGTVNVGEDDTGHDVSFYGQYSGGRFFWNQEKMALRSGRDYDGTHWLPDSLGRYSLATGYNTKAVGDKSTALGYETTARGDYSMAMGRNTAAGGLGSLAAGRGTIASGNYSTALGYETSASGNYSAALGYQAAASGQSSIALGQWLKAGPANYTITLGRGVHGGDSLANNVENSLMVGFNTNTPTLFVGGSEHRVGVGTSSPGEKLDVNGTARVTGFSLPTGASDGYVLTTDGAGVGTWQPTAVVSDGDWTISGDDMYSNVTGNVGIGTSSPTYELDVSGDVGINEYLYHNGDANTYLRFGSDQIDLYAGDLWMITAIEQFIGDDVVIINAAGKDVDFRVKSMDNTYAINVDGSVGNVGIGGTGSPMAKLHVRQDSTADILRLVQGGTTKLIVKDDGKVGIGDMTPEYELDVSGDAGINEHLYHNDDENTYLKFSTDQVDLYAGDVQMITADETTQDVVVINKGGADVDFRVKSVPDSNAIFVRGSDGNVAIGTTILENTKLHVLQTGNGRAGHFQIQNASNDSAALTATTDGDGYAVYAKYNTSGTFGILGMSGWGSYGQHSSPGGNWGVLGTSSAGVYGNSTDENGVHGHSQSSSGVYGYSSGSHGVHGFSVNGDAGYFDGDVTVIGNLSKGGGSFVIDHPLDPENKLLRHNFVESPENLLIYRGKAQLDAIGETVVEMPDYFKVLTKEDQATIHLTSVGRPFLTGYEWQSDGASFMVYGESNRKVAWMVMADRDDPVIHQLARPVEEDKGPDNKLCDRGELLYPMAYGYPESMGKDYKEQEEMRRHEPEVER